MARIFLFIYNRSSAHKPFFYSIVFAVVLLLAFSASRLSFEEDISRMLPLDEKLSEVNAVVQNSKFKDKLVINIFLADSTASPDPDKLTAYAGELTDSLNAKFFPSHIGKITRVTEDEINNLYTLFYENLPIFLEPADYDSIEARLTEANIRNALQRGYKSLVSPAGFALKESFLKDPLGLTPIVLKKLQLLQLENIYEAKDGFIITKDHRNLLLFATPVYSANETSENRKLITGIAGFIQSLSDKYDDMVTAEYFGGAAMAVENANRLKKDISLTVSLALAFLIVFISLFFRRKSVILLIFLPSAFGVLFSLACLHLLVQHVSLIALGAGSILIGITINFPLHLLTHFKKERSIVTLFSDITQPLLTSSLTTAAAFFCLLFLQADAMNDLGLFVGLSIIGAALFTLLVLPVLLNEKSAEVPRNAGSPGIIDRMAAYEYHKNRYLILAIAAFSVVCLFTFDDVEFESDLSRMNYFPEHLKKAEEHLNKINRYSLKSVFLISKANSLDSALANNEKLRDKIERLQNENVVQKYSGIGDLFPSASGQYARIQQWNQFWTDEKKQRLKEMLSGIGSQYKFKDSAFTGFYEVLDRNFQVIPLENLDKIRTLFLDNFISETDEIATVTTLLKVEEEKKKEAYAAFKDIDNLIIFDNKWLTYHILEILKNNLSLLVTLSISLFFLIVIHSFGRVEIGLITFIPMAASWLWTLGIMGAFGIKFNMINIIISSFIFGLGDDYSIFLSGGYLQEYKYGVRNTVTYKTSMLLSAITTLAGIGVLIFAGHPALRSIALMSVTGILSVVIITFTVQPLLLETFIVNRKRLKRHPINLVNFLKALLTWGFLLLGVIIVGIAGLLIFTILPVNASRRKAIFHRIFMHVSKAYIKITFPLSCKIHNEHGEDFKKPAVVICNHQSLIETPLVLMQAPKLIILTNDRIRRTPHFGPIARFADFYSVSSGIDPVMGKLKQMADDGYSIVVFPEGTRSTDYNIHRFHKGAFYIAEKLNLDIVPMLFHGTGEFLHKNEFWGRRNKIAVKVMSRIFPDDQRFGKTYSERAKGIRKHMIKAYDGFRKEKETPEYLKRMLMCNYIYKGPVLEWYVRVKLWLEDNYKLANEKLPAKGEILDIGCGYGYMTYMLAFYSRERTLTGVDYDSEKIAVAQNCYSKNDNIQFECANILETDIPEKDGFILGDVLHYLRKDEQVRLLKKCFSRLREKGTIIIRDADASLRKRQFGTALTEIISTVTGFNKKVNPLEFVPAGEIIALAEAHGMTAEVIDDSKLTSNVFIIIRN